MGQNTIFYIFGALAVIYLIISMTNRRKAKGRRNRKFMDEYKRKNEKE